MQTPDIPVLGFRTLTMPAAASFLTSAWAQTAEADPHAQVKFTDPVDGKRREMPVYALHVYLETIRMAMEMTTKCAEYRRACGFSPKSEEVEIERSADGEAQKLTKTFIY